MDRSVAGHHIRPGFIRSELVRRAIRRRLRALVGRPAPRGLLAGSLYRIRRLPAPGLSRLWPRPLWRSVGPCDVLILTATYGNGHVQAGRALIDSLSQLRPGVRVRALDFFELVNPVLNVAARTAYLYSVRRAPVLWREFYVRTGQVRPDSFWQQRLFHLGAGALRRVLQAARPRVVVSTHPTPGGVMAQLRREGFARGVEAITVITDFVLHSQWVHPDTDLYLAPCLEVAEELKQRGIPHERIRVTGIPVRPEFATPVDGQAVRRRLGLAESPPVVLVMTGAFGMMRGALSACRAVVSLPVPVQVVIVTGHDHKLRAGLEEVAARSPHRVRVMGYVDDIHELMAISDLLVSKAGGLTVSEALALGLPMVIYAPIPGQEEGNAALLTRHGVAQVASSPAHLADILSRLVADEARRLDMARRARSLGRPTSAQLAAACVLERIP